MHTYIYASRSATLHPLKCCHTQAGAGFALYFKGSAAARTRYPPQDVVFGILVWSWAIVSILAVVVHGTPIYELLVGWQHGFTTQWVRVPMRCHVVVWLTLPTRFCSSGIHVSREWRIATSYDLRQHVRRRCRRVQRSTRVHNRANRSNIDRDGVLGRADSSSPGNRWCGFATRRANGVES